MSSQTSPNEPPTLDEKWRTAYTCLLAYRDAHAGNANPPQRAKDPQTGFAIGKWVTNQRTAHQQGRLDPDKHNLLVQAGVIFDRAQVAALGMASPNRANTYSTKRATTCQRVLAELHALQDAGMDVNTVGRHYGTPTFASLGRAVRDIQHDHTNGVLPRDIEAALEATGLVFVGGPQARAMHVHDTTLERTLTCLGHYRAARPGEHAPLAIPVNYQCLDCGAWLYFAVNKLRHKARLGQLGSHDTQRLSDAGVAVPHRGQSLAEATAEARARRGLPGPSEPVLDGEVVQFEIEPPRSP